MPLCLIPATTEDTGDMKTYSVIEHADHCNVVSATETQSGCFVCRVAHRSVGDRIARLLNLEEQAAAQFDALDAAMRPSKTPRCLCDGTSKPNCPIHTVQHNFGGQEER